MMNFLNKNLRIVALLFIMVGILFSSLNAVRNFEDPKNPTRIFIPPYQGLGDYETIQSEIRWLQEVLNRIKLDHGPYVTKALEHYLEWVLCQIHGYWRSSLGQAEQRQVLMGLDEKLRSYLVKLQRYRRESNYYVEPAFLRVENIKPEVERLIKALTKVEINDLTFKFVEDLEQDMDWIFYRIQDCLKYIGDYAIRNLEARLRPYRRQLQGYRLFLQNDPLGILVVLFKPGEQRFNEADKMLQNGQITVRCIEENKELLDFDPEVVQSLRVLIDMRESVEACPRCRREKRRSEIIGINPCRHRACEDCFALMVSNPGQKCAVCKSRIRLQ